MQSLSITAKQNKRLTSNQEQFNRLTEQIEKLSRKLVKEKQKLDHIYTYYSKEITPLEQDTARYLLKMALCLHQASKKHKFGAQHKKLVGSVILYLCDNAFVQITPNEEEEAMYDAWSESTYQEELEEEEEMAKIFAAETLKYTHGIDIDPDDFEDTPEGHARFKERMQEEIEKQEQEAAHRDQNRKKTKKQLKEEARQQEEESLKLKSLRSIYISLAKVLHPDTNSNELENAQKDELMKKVTKAYADKDLSALLKLEMEWVTTEHKRVDQLSDDKLKLYIASLKERLAELKNEEFGLLIDPRYEPISEWKRKTEKGAINALNKKKTELNHILSMMQADLAQLQNNNSKSRTLAFAQKIEAQAGLDDDDDFDDFGDFDSMAKSELINAFAEMLREAGKGR